MPVVNTYASFIKHKQEDGSYVVIYPINTSDEVYVDINTKLTLTSKINTMDATISENKESIVEDIITILSSLSPMFPKPVLLNHLYVDDFGSKTKIAVNKGISIPGKIII